MIVGIDLGTTNSLVAYYKDGEAHLIPNRLGEYLTPSVISVNEKDEILVGEIAKEYGALHPSSMARTFKRNMGTNHTYLLGMHEFSAEELSSFVLKSLKEDAEAYLMEDVEEAIISVPAYFNDKQRKATKRAGELAGLKVSRIINEPTAAAISYGVGDEDKMERVLVFDLGGGTFDVSILEYFCSIMEVHAIAGDNHLGGEDFTNVLVDMFLKQIHVNRDDLDLITMNRIYKEAEKAKISFSKNKTVTIAMDVNSVYYEEDFELEDYEKECLPLLERIRKPIEKSIYDAKITLEDIDRVLLVGGASRMPMIRSFVRKMLKVYPDYFVDPDTSVAQGCALQCGMKARDKQIEEMILTDVCPFTLGCEVIRYNGAFEESGHFLPIIERNTVIPVSKKQTVYTAYDDQERVNVKVLQGESRMARNNLLIGQVSVEVPRAPRGEEAIDITYTYDVNSLLEVEVEVVSTQEKKKIIIQNEENKVSEEEAQARLEKLQYLKQNPREDEENYFVITKGNRLYEQSIGKDRDIIEKALENFEHVLANGSRLEIERARKRTLELFEDMDHQESVGYFS
ncbi:MAG: molecular chaperone HscC [Firmicutes bacterium]|nr:molecular chaperone HscC [Bacillota bacterium]